KVIWREPQKLIFSFFFFQAEDGIRDRTVTGVQTCALPISPCACSSYWQSHSRRRYTASEPTHTRKAECHNNRESISIYLSTLNRSEERRVGKEWRCWLGAVE